MSAAFPAANATQTRGKRSGSMRAAVEMGAEIIGDKVGAILQVH
jgi:hypothetical protein